MLIPRQQNLWTITTRKKTRFCVSFFVLVRFCSAKPVACGRVTERARETRLRFPSHTFPSLRYAGVRTTKVVGNHTRLQKPMAFGGCPLSQLTNTAVPWYNETPKQVWIFLEHCLHFSPRIRQGVRRFLLRGTTDEHILPTHRVRRTDRHGSQLLAE